MRKPINKLRFLKFLKQAETAQKFEATYQQNKIFKVFEKSGNGGKIWGNGPKIWGNRLTKWDFKIFEKNGYGSKILGNGPKIWEKRSIIWDFLKLLKKSGNE